jgi:hypothetical protein
MKIKFFLILLMLVSGIPIAVSSEQDNIVSHTYSKDAFPLVHKGVAAPMYIDTVDAEVVNIAARAFRHDLRMVAGTKPPPIYKNKTELEEFPIIAGTLGNSELIDRLAANGKVNFDQIKGKWETFLITVIEKPFKGVKKALVIAGSDRRGTAYGIFELSKIIGVSPWVWWADVTPKKQEAIYLNIQSSVYGPPSVKYRGIFLNDEDWGLKPWAAKQLDTDIKDIGPQTYSRIFELMLRLKANYLWPAMHDCTKAFYFYPNNPKIADKYAIVVGSSHCEPILRNNVFEWKENFLFEYGKYPGEWRYDLNKDQIYKYWDDRAKQSSKFESVYTIGMRGIHDGSMPGPKDLNEKLKLLDTVITDQRGILAKQLGKPIFEIPQIFCPYKEVLTLYQKGLKLPDDVTIVWADDNHGYIRQLSNTEEQKRSGSSGVYYHLSYWGSPHDYLWLSSISPSLMAFEMTKAYQFGANRLWVFNVGDIKPAELETEFAMDLAWDINKWPPLTANNYAKEWAARTFGVEFADSIAFIKTQYYQLAHAGKPEHLGALTFTQNEMQERINTYQKIASVSERLYQVMPGDLKDAFFQLIYYPVFGAKLMNEKIFYARLSLDLVAQKDSAGLEYTVKSYDAYDRIQYLTKKYNEEIAQGKWNGMMSASPRNLAVFKMPKVATEEMFIDSVNNEQKGVDSLGKAETMRDLKETIKLNASDFVNKSDSKDRSIISINGLGLDGKGITISPFIAPSIPDNEINIAPYVEYKVNMDGGSRKIMVKCLPTHAIYKGREVRYAISVNNDSLQVVNLNSPAESATWKKNVLRGFSVGETNHILHHTGEAIIRIYLPDTGVVLNRIEVE